MTTQPLAPTSMDHDRGSNRGRRVDDLWLRLLTEDSNDILCELRQGFVTYVSPNVGRVSGHTQADFVGRPFAQFIHPDDLPMIVPMMAPGWTGDIDVTFRLADAAGSWQWREVRGARRIEGDGSHHSVLVLRDVNRRQVAEEALLASEQKYRSLVDAARDVVFAIDVEGNFTSINPVASDLYGYTHEEFLGMNFRHIVDAQSLPGMMENMARAVRGEPMLAPMRFLTQAKGGRSIWVEVVAPPVVVEGQVVGFQGIARDITERVRAEIAHAESDARSTALVRAIPDMMFRLDSNGVYLDFKAERSEELLVPPDQIIGRSIRDLVPGEVAERAMDAIQTALATGALQIMEYTINVPAGEQIFEARLTPVGVREVVAIVRNITEQRRALAALRDSEEKYRLVIEEARDLVYAHDLLGNLTEINPAGLAMFGYAPDEIDGLNFANVIDPAYLPLALENMQRAFRGEEMLGDLEFLAHAKDGSQRWLEITPTPIRRNGEIVGFRGIARNVTDRKRAQREVREAEEHNTLLAERARIAQELHDNVAQFFFGIGIASKDLLERKSATPATIRRRLSHIRDLSVQGGREIRNAIQALSTEDAAEDFPGSFERLLEPLRTDGIDVGFAQDLHRPLGQQTEREMYRAARELIFNARKHARASRVDVCLEGHEDEVVLTVRDDGVGSVASLQNRGAEGTGLGLRALSDRFTSLGGKLELQDRDGGGIQIRCVLPVERA